jgi:hypothetical protein
MGVPLADTESVGPTSWQLYASESHLRQSYDLDAGGCPGNY